LQLQNLATLKTDDDVLERLGKISPTLEDLYSEIYQRIKQNQGEISQKIARNVFSLLLSLERNLLPHDFSTLAQPTENELSPQVILDICCNLVVLDETLQVFRLAHLSVREFLEKLPEFSSTKSHATVATCCMKIAGKWDEDLARRIDAEFYVQTSMLYHFQEAGGDERLRQPFLMEFIRLIREDLEPKITFADYWTGGWLDWVCIQPLPKDVNPSLRFIFNACALGFSEMVKNVIDATLRLGNISTDCPLISESPGANAVFAAFQELPRPKEFSVRHLKKAVVPEAIRQLSVHAIRHGNYEVLKYLFENKLCSVTEDLLKKAVVPHTRHRACHRYWSEPADIVNLMLDYGGMEHVTTAVVRRAVTAAWMRGKGFTTLVIRTLLNRGLVFSLNKEFLDSINLQTCGSRLPYVTESLILLAEVRLQFHISDLFPNRII